MADSWEQNEKFITSELSRLNHRFDELQQNVDRRFDDNQKYRIEAMVKISSDIAVLKVKAGLWGAVGSMMSMVGLLLIQMMTRKA